MHFSVKNMKLETYKVTRAKIISGYDMVTKGEKLWLGKQAVKSLLVGRGRLHRAYVREDNYILYTRM